MEISRRAFQAYCLGIQGLFFGLLGFCLSGVKEVRLTVCVPIYRQITTIPEWNMGWIYGNCSR